MKANTVTLETLLRQSLEHPSVRVQRLGRRANQAISGLLDELEADAQKGAAFYEQAKTWGAAVSSVRDALPDLSAANGPRPHQAE